MRSRIAVLVAALALTGVGVAAAQTDAPDPTPLTCDGKSATKHYREAKATIKAGWSLGNWREGPKKAQRRQVSKHIACLERRQDRGKIKSLRSRAAKKLSLYREYRSLTPYRCQSGRYGYWAKACYIIACESGYSWTAYNPSGARGPYQFLGWPVPWPVRSFKDKIAHHRMATQLGNSHWVCA